MKGEIKYGVFLWSNGIYTAATYSEEEIKDFKKDDPKLIKVCPTWRSAKITANKLNNKEA